MNTRSKSGLFLIELIVVILVFALSAATCLRLFFESRQLAAESRNLSSASLAVQSAADCYKSAGGSLEKTAEILGGVFDSNTLSVGYDGMWRRTEESPVFSVVLMSLTDGESVVFARTAQEGTIIFSVTVRGGLNLG